MTDIVDRPCLFRARINGRTLTVEHSTVVNEIDPLWLTVNEHIKDKCSRVMACYTRDDDDWYWGEVTTVDVHLYDSCPAGSSDHTCALQRVEKGKDAYGQREAIEG